jgi:2-methylfumaryl-CoA hydratase
MTKTNSGNFFEDFKMGQVIAHATPRTVTEGDQALYTALYGSRFALQSSDEFAGSVGLRAAPIDDLLAFHVVFGKTVPDISLNAVANLGYAECRFLAPVYPGDTLTSRSEVIGLKQNSNGKTGVVYVRSTGTNQDGVDVIDYVRWVMVRKGDESAPAPEAVEPELATHVDVADLVAPGVDFGAYDCGLAGSAHLWDDYEAGEVIDHEDGVTIEEAEHMMATRLYQNTAKVHFNQFAAENSRFGRRLIYGGHIISVARSLSFNGLANGPLIAAINSGAHVSPCFAGNTVFAWSSVIDKQSLTGRQDVGALRVRTVACKDAPCDAFPYKDEAGKYHEAVILDLDYWLFLPRR